MTKPHRTELTEREREVATLVGKGMTNKEIARLLGIADFTVGDTLRQIFRITDSSTRTEVGVYACKQGWL